MLSDKFTNLGVESSIAFKSELYLYMSSLIQDMSVLIFAIRSIDFCSKVRSSKPSLNIRYKCSMSYNRTWKIWRPFVRARILIIVYWRIKFKTTEYKALY